MTVIRLFQGDNFQFVESGSVDLILTDPPFNISRETNFASYSKNRVHSFKFDNSSSEKWDTVSHEDFLSLMDSWSEEWFRVLRKGGSFVVFCGDVYISHLWESLKKSGLHPRRVFVWRKNNAVPVNRKFMPMSANEYMIVGVKKGSNQTFNSDVPALNQDLSDRMLESVLIADKVSSIVNRKVFQKLKNRDTFSTLEEGGNEEDVVQMVEKSIDEALSEVKKRLKNMYKVSDDGETFLQGCVPNYVEFPLKTGSRIHPTEKPVDLLSYLISLYSKPGNLILDSFSGSGSTGEAAYGLGRSSILIERDSSFAEVSSRRLREIAGDDFFFDSIEKD